VNCSSYEFGDLGFHNCQRLRGLGGEGAELGILRRWDLRRWGGKMHPAGSEGEMVLSSLPGFLPAEAAGAHPPGPRAPSRLWPSNKSIMDWPGDYPQQVSPMFVYNITPRSELLTYFPFGCIMNYGFLLFLRKGRGGAGCHRAPGCLSLLPERSALLLELRSL